MKIFMFVGWWEANIATANCHLLINLLLKNSFIYKILYLMSSVAQSNWLRCDDVNQFWWHQQRGHVLSLPVPFGSVRLHAQSSGKVTHLPGKKKRCTTLQCHFSDVLVKAHFGGKLTAASRSNLCPCQELKTGDGSHIRGNRQCIGRKICSADSTAGALAVTGSSFC